MVIALTEVESPDKAVREVVRLRQMKLPVCIGEEAKYKMVNAVT